MAFDASYRLRGGVFTSGGSRFWSSLRCASVGSGSSKNISHIIQAASGTRSGSFMSVPTRLCSLGGRFATPSDAGWGIRHSRLTPDGYQHVGRRRRECSVHAIRDRRRRRLGRRGPHPAAALAARPRQIVGRLPARTDDEQLGMTGAGFGPRGGRGDAGGRVGARDEAGIAAQCALRGGAAPLPRRVAPAKSSNRRAPAV